MNMLPDNSEPSLPLSDPSAVAPNPDPAKPDPGSNQRGNSGDIPPEAHEPGGSTTPDPHMMDALTDVEQGGPACRIFGIGTAGLNLLELLAKASSDLDKACLVAVHSDTRALAASTIPLKVHLESRLTRGLGTAGDPARGRAAAEERLPRLKQLCANARVVFLIAGLGGGAGTGIAPVLAKVAKEAGALVLVFAVMPFDCEGSLRMRVARAGLQELLSSADLVICQPNQKAFTCINETTSLADTFKAANEMLARSVSTAWHGLVNESVMGMPFSDLCILIQQSSSQAAFPVAGASGVARIEEVTERLLDHPILGGRGTLCKAEALAVLILSGPDLTMVEVNRLMDRIHKESGGTPVMMGAAVSRELKDELRVGLLLAGPDMALPARETVLPRNASCAEPDPEEADVQMVDRMSPSKHPSRFVPPPPPATPERIDQVRRHRKTSPRMRQGQLPLEIVSKGRFEKSEPTIHQGEDLDIPTYIRRHVSLN